MKIIISPQNHPKSKTTIDISDSDVELSDVFSGVGIKTDQGMFGIAIRDGGIEVMLDGVLVWSSTSNMGDWRLAYLSGIEEKLKQ